MSEFRVKLERNKLVTFKDLTEFVERRSRMGKSSLGQLAVGKSERRQERASVFSQSRKRTYFISSAQKETEEDVAPETPLYPECKSFHTLWRCRLFQDKPVKNPCEIVKKYQLCFNCCGTYIARKYRCRKCNVGTTPSFMFPLKNMWRQESVVQMLMGPELILLTWRKFLNRKTNKGVFAPQERLIVQIAERYGYKWCQQQCGAYPTGKR